MEVKARTSNSNKDVQEKASESANRPRASSSAKVPASFCAVCNRDLTKASFPKMAVRKSKESQTLEQRITRVLDEKNQVESACKRKDKELQDMIGKHSLQAAELLEWKKRYQRADKELRIQKSRLKCCAKCKHDDEEEDFSNSILLKRIDILERQLLREQSMNRRLLESKFRHHKWRVFENEASRPSSLLQRQLLFQKLHRKEPAALTMGNEMLASEGGGEEELYAQESKSNTDLRLKLVDNSKVIQNYERQIRNMSKDIKFFKDLLAAKEEFTVGQMLKLGKSKI